MTAENFDNVVQLLCDRRPFGLFTIELNTGEMIEIDHPKAISYRNGVATFIAPGGRPMWFDHDSVNKIVPGRVETSKA